MSGHVVVERSPATVTEVVARRDGRRAVTVSDVDGARAALLDALDGVRLVVDLGLTGSERLVFLEDLARIGAVDHRIGPSVLDRLTEDERAVLRELAAGRSLGEVADTLNLSRRTADRRLAAARATLGSATTAEAVAAFSAAVRG